MAVYDKNQFDIRDAIERFEELEDAERDDDEQEEFGVLSSLLEDTKGYGGDHQWRGDWYPVGFIADSHFEDYARELAEDIGAIDKDAGWPCGYIDWPRAAEALQIDYSSVEINGDTYWYR